MLLNVSILLHSDFNSIKVRLEPSGTSGSTIINVSFQFHKGTIRTNDIKAVRNLDYKFQFHKGTIRTRSGTGFCVGWILFQFHKGTIRTTKAKRKLAWETLFQFHKGTIRTHSISTNVKSLSYFNSIKVRLEPDIH